MTRLPFDADRVEDRPEDSDDTPATDDRAIESRVAALERAVGGADPQVVERSGADAALATGADDSARLDAMEERLAELEATIADLEAATQALRGYVGSIRSVNERVRARADRALALASTSRATESPNRSVAEDVAAEETAVDEASANESTTDRRDTPGTEGIHGEPPAIESGESSDWAELDGGDGDEGGDGGDGGGCTTATDEFDGVL